MEENVAEVPPDKARKRIRAPETWKRAKAKVQRYSAKTPPGLPSCNHGQDNKHFKCKKITMLDIQSFHGEFYKTKNKKDQDAFILKHCKVTKIKRRRPRVGVRKPTEHTTKLYVRRRGDTKLLLVCQKTFLGILNISAHRIRKVSQTFTATGSVVQERRGGDHTSAKNRNKLIAVKAFIEKFQCIESHYCRSTVIRKYLSSSLNIRKMWKLYCQQCEEGMKVLECYFRSVFTRCYNLGFGSPRTDTCSKCSELTEKIKSCTRTSEKALLMAEMRVHKLKARAFYRLLKEKRDDLMVLSFDCQKNQVLPKVSDQAAYYSRQLYIYNFAVVRTVPENTLKRENVTLYTWTEDEHRKGSNEIASAVFDCLQNTSFNENITTVRLVADGCGAQNKNTTMVGMCSNWLNRCAPQHITSVELVFPVPGHSFLPPDRVFGLIEKEIKNMEIILTPDQYIEVFEKAKLEDVKKLLQKHFGDEWESRDDINYYREVLSRATGENDTPEYEEQICDAALQETDMRV
ncbi:unnamed protein product [Colias eurytheme]|nr:unnamed protein product [Colias eurytheme]